MRKDNAIRIGLFVCESFTTTLVYPYKSNSVMRKIYFDATPIFHIQELGGNQLGEMAKSVF